MKNNRYKNILIFSDDLDSNFLASRDLTNSRFQLSFVSERKKPFKGPHYKRFSSTHRKNRMTVNKNGCYVVMSIQVIFYRPLIYGN